MRRRSRPEILGLIPIVPRPQSAAVSRRIGVAAVAIAVGVVLPGLARAQAQAQATEEICFSTASEGQRARNAGHLLEAKTAFTTCAGSSCDPKVVSRCVAWLAEVEEAIPSIVIYAKDADGRDRSDLRLVVDGRPANQFARGMALPLDPGRHELRIVGRDAAITETVVLHEREKGRVVHVVFPGAETKGESKSGLGAAWALGGVAVLSAGVAGYFAISGLSDRSSFGCATLCTQSEADSVSRRLLLADIFGLTAIVSAGVATWLLLSRSSAAPPRRAALSGDSSGGRAVR